MRRRAAGWRSSRRAVMSVAARGSEVAGASTVNRAAEAPGPMAEDDGLAVRGSAIQTGRRRRIPAAGCFGYPPNAFLYRYSMRFTASASSSPARRFHPISERKLQRLSPRTRSLEQRTYPRRAASPAGSEGIFPLGVNQVIPGRYGQRRPPSVRPSDTPVAHHRALGAGERIRFALDGSPVAVVAVAAMCKARSGQRRDQSGNQSRSQYGRSVWLWRSRPSAFRVGYPLGTDIRSQRTACRLSGNGVGVPRPDHPGRPPITAVIRVRPLKYLEYYQPDADYGHD